MQFADFAIERDGNIPDQYRFSIEGVDLEQCVRAILHVRRPNNQVSDVEGSVDFLDAQQDHRITCQLPKGTMPGNATCTLWLDLSMANGTTQRCPAVGEQAVRRNDT
jgi:hypothetical protein